MKYWSKSTKLSAALLTAMLCASCSKETPVIVVTAKPFVTRIPVVCVSKDDQLTDETARQLLRNNVGIETLQGSKAKCKR